MIQVKNSYPQAQIIELNRDSSNKQRAKKYTMMTKEPYPGKTISGQIFFDIIHGTIYTHEDSIKTINK